MDSLPPLSTDISESLVMSFLEPIVLHSLFGYFVFNWDLLHSLFGFFILGGGASSWYVWLLPSW